MAVARAGKLDARLLPAGKVDPLLADLCLRAGGKQLEVGLERARRDDAVETLLVEGLREGDVLLRNRQKPVRNWGDGCKIEYHLLFRWSGRR